MAYLLVYDTHCAVAAGLIGRFARRCFSECSVRFRESVAGDTAWPQNPPNPNFSSMKASLSLLAFRASRTRGFVILMIIGIVLAGCARARPPEPIAGPYLRGVNNTTFLWFEGYDERAGNESVASYAFEASRGVSVVRLPISWERIQPELGGDLDPVEVARLKTELGRAHNNGIRIVVDLHNGCRYRRSDGTVLTCSRGIGLDQFADVWTKLSAVLENEPGVVAYDLMNEPNSLTADGSNTRDDAIAWEQFSQGAVDAIRAAGDNRQLMIEAVSWSNVDSFGDLHPKAWISDPLDAVVYSAHQYFDQTGRYTVAGNGVPELRYSYWSSRLQENGTTGDRSFEDWNLYRLEEFVDWIASNRVRGDIGEIGWPSYEEMLASGLPPSEATDEAQRWNALAEKWFRIADAASLSVTYWAASGLQSTSYPGSPPGLPEPNAVFVHGAGNGELRDSAGAPILTPDGHFQPRDIDTANSQYEVLSRHPSSG